MKNAFDESDVIVYEPMGMPRLDVILSRDSIWMTMQQMGQVFGVDRSVIGKHIRNIYKTGELEQKSTWAKIAQVHKEGKREVVRTLPFYNLDMIISVGYRVNSLKATRFRQWATRILREMLLKRLEDMREIAKLKRRVDVVEGDIKQIKGGMNYLVKQLSGPDAPRRKIGFGAKPGETSATPYGRAK